MSLAAYSCSNVSLISIGFYKGTPRTLAMSCPILPSIGDLSSELATNVFTSEWIVVDNYNIEPWAFEQGFCVKKRDKKTYTSLHRFDRNTRMPNLRQFRSSSNLYVALFEDGTVKT